MLDYWDILEHIKGMGEDKVKVTKANTFAALCDFGCVKRLQLKVEVEEDEDDIN